MQIVKFNKIITYKNWTQLPNHTFRLGIKYKQISLSRTRSTFPHTCQWLGKWGEAGMQWGNVGECVHWAALGADLVRTHQPSHWIQAESWFLLTSHYSPASGSLVFTSAVCFSVHIRLLFTNNICIQAHGCGCVWWQWWWSEWSLEPTECGWPVYTCTAYTGRYCAVLHCTLVHRQYSTAWLYKTVQESHYNTAVVALENVCLYKTLTFNSWQEISINHCITNEVQRHWIMMQINTF